jgi:hypothetical protein
MARGADQSNYWDVDALMGGLVLPWDELEECFAPTGAPGDRSDEDELLLEQLETSARRGK